MSLLSLVLLALTALGTLYYVASTLALVSHCRKDVRPGPRPPAPSPRLSVLKPVCGLDCDSRANFQSYLDQDYPNYEAIFGALDHHDAAVPLIREVIAGNENASLMTGSEIEGANNKVRVLHSLAKRATGEILVITDADTRVAPGFLRRMASPFGDPSVGAVTCLYRGVGASFDRLRMKGAADSLAGLHMTCVFAPGVACAQRLYGIDFGLGAAIAIRRSVLEEIGGFEAIVDYLADDFQLGRRAAQAGYRVVLSDYVVEIVLGGESLGGVLARELRWSRTTKASRPAGHFGLIVTFGFTYACLFLIASGFSALGWGVMVGVLGVRSLTACFGARAMGDAGVARRAWLLPLRDLLSFGIWVAGYCSRTVRWRGRRLRLLQGGKMAVKDKGGV